MPKKKMISLRMDAELLASLDAEAERVGLDRTTVLSRLMQLYLDGDVLVLNQPTTNGREIKTDHLASEWKVWVDEQDVGETDHHIDGLDFSALTDSQVLNAKARIEAKTNKDEQTGCWEWTGYVKDDESYGCVTVAGKVHRAHRASYALFKGPVPAGMHVRHICANRRCVSPAHLLVGTPTENQRDFWRKKRAAGRLQGHLVTPMLSAAFPASFTEKDVGEPLEDVLDHHELRSLNHPPTKEEP